MKRLAILISIIFVCLGINAQADSAMRFGYLSYEAALQSMPDYTVVQKKLADLRQQFQNETLRVEDEFNRKYEDFLEGQREFPQSILQKRQIELQELMDKNIAFKENSRKELEKAEQELMAPLKIRLIEGTMCSTGKKTPKSRGGVIHSWMLLIHSKVPCIFAMPAMKQTGRRMAILVVLIVMKLQIPITAAAPQSSCWLVKRNFIRKSIGNQTAIPAKPV